MEFIKLDPATAFDKAITARNGDPKLIVCGSQKEIGYLEETMGLWEQSSQEIIDASLNINVEKWFRDRMAETQDEWGMENDFNYDNEDDEDADDLEWTGEAQAKLGFTLASDVLTGEPIQDLAGLEISVDENWQIPAVFKYGGWNECPEPADHCAIWKYWQEKYGAKIVGVSYSIIEAYVERPPQTQEEVMQLAMEQYLYCPDIVDQGMETVENLAALLLNQDVWYFWWD
jgi:hypothetical protein